MPHKYAQNIKVKQKITVHSLRNHNDWHLSPSVIKWLLKPPHQLALPSRTHMGHPPQVSGWCHSRPEL